MFYRGCGGIAAVDEGFAVTRLRRRDSSELLSSTRGKIATADQDTFKFKGETVIEGHGHAAAFVDHHGDRREIIGSRRTYAGSGYHLPKRVLREPVKRLFR